MEDEESDFIEEESTPTFKPWHVLFAIDTHYSMFIKREDGRSVFQDCLEALLYCADSSLILTPRSMKSPLGVVLAENDVDKAQFVKYTQTMPENVKFLQHQCEKSNEVLREEFERKGNFDFADFLLLCKHQLDQLKVEAYKKTIIYISNDSNPAGKDDKLKEKICRSLENLREMGVHLRIITMDEDFDYECFYEGLFSSLDFIPLERVNSCEDLQELLSSYLQIKLQKYSTKFYPFQGKWKKYLLVHLISYIRTAEIKNNIHVTRDRHMQVRKKQLGEKIFSSEVVFTNPANKESPQIIVPRELSIHVTETDLPKGITFLYTCKRISIPGWVVKSSAIIQSDPKETLPYFLYLWNSCVRLGLVIICFYKYRDNAKVSYVELEPKRIANIESFLMRFLPYAEDIKGFPSLVPCGFLPEEETAMNDLVENLTFDFNQKQFSNPVYRRKEEFVKSQLMERSLSIEDNTKEREQREIKIHEVVKEEIQILKKSFCDSNEEKKGRKRKKEN